MQICEQVIYLRLGHGLAKSRHHVSTVDDDVPHALIVREQPALFHELSREQALHARSLFSARRVGLMAAIAIGVIKLTSGCLLRVQSELSVAFSTLDLTTK